MDITELCGALLVLTDVMVTARTATFWRNLVRYCNARFESDGSAEMSRHCPTVSSNRSTSDRAQTDHFFHVISTGCCGEIAEDLKVMFK